MRFTMLLLALLLAGCSSSPRTTYNKTLDTFDYPYPVQTFSFQSQKQNLNMKYMDIGDKNAEKIALLLHGKNFSGYYWTQTAKILTQKGYRVIIPDQIGFGKSTKPTNYNYSFAQLALNTNNLMRSLGIKSYTAIGHSMGGMLGVHMASMFTQSISKLVLINPIGLEDYLKYTEYKDPDFFYKNELNTTLESFRNYQVKNYYDGKWSDDYEALLMPFKGQRSGGDWEIIAWNNAQTYSPIFIEGIEEKLALLKTETHIILGTRDRTAPGKAWQKPNSKRELGRYDRLGREIKKRNPKIHLYELEGLGHMPQFEDLGRFTEVFKKTI
jgi:pimeloyl-ACP methyl ester carboxylesterase